MSAPYTLHFDSNNAEALIEILHQDEERFKAVAALHHTTEAEQQLLLGKAAVVQMAYFQLEGIQPFRRQDGGPDWSEVTPPKHEVNDEGHHRLITDSETSPWESYNMVARAKDSNGVQWFAVTEYYEGCFPVNVPFQANPLVVQS